VFKSPSKRITGAGCFGKKTPKKFVEQFGFGHLALQLIASGLLGSTIITASYPHFGHDSVI
jgi:hypothetical protein